MSQVIDNELKHYMGLLNLSQKKSILAVIKTFLPSSEKSERISKEQYNIEINAAENRINKGDYFSQEEVEEETAKW